MCSINSILFILVAGRNDFDVDDVVEHFEDTILNLFSSKLPELNGNRGYVLITASELTQTNLVYV